MQDLLAYFNLSNVLGVAITFAPKVIAAILVIAVFWVLTRVTTPGIRRLLVRARFAEPLIHLLVDNVYRWTLFTIALVMAASQLGIDVAAALAGIGVVGIAVGFAAQETIANMIAGFLIFWDRPFEVGDFVTTLGKYGQVRDITMRTTRIRTPENTFVVLPNKQIIGELLVNHSMLGHMRVNIPLGIAYKEDIRRARPILLEAARATPGVLADPAPDVVTSELGGSSVNLQVRVWIHDAKEELSVFFNTLEACKIALDTAGIEIPYPHLQLFVDDVRPQVWDKLAAWSAGSPGPGGK
ncbi:MAG TPA: mechanosensitive ion channel family protein [Gemmatimonadales bacterium]|nr:mechanosensitive ion channel family protein [Gemmatimonadales bacterium]